MLHSRKWLLGSLAVALAPFAVLTERPDPTASDDPAPQVRIDLENLAPLAEGRYELWIIGGGKPHLAGVLEPNADGVVDGVTFSAPTGVSSVEAAVITYENDDDTEPSASKLIGAVFGNRGQAEFVIAGFAVEEAFTPQSARGEFFLRTPSDDADGNNGNDEQGVWIGTPAMPPEASLMLPRLNEGWVYEGWVVNVGDGGPYPLTTGRFGNDQGINGSHGLDSDKAGPFGGTANDGPPIPGNDYVRDIESVDVPEGLSRPPYALNDGEWMVVITLEPTDNDTPGPFAVKPLGTRVEDGAATAPETIEFGFDPLGSIPTGSATIVGQYGAAFLAGDPPAICQTGRDMDTAPCPGLSPFLLAHEHRLRTCPNSRTGSRPSSPS